MATKTITTPGEIRPGERRELKTLVKQKIAVLRAQVDQEYAAKVAKVDRAVAEQFKEQDARMAKLAQEVHDLIELSNLRLQEILARYADVISPHCHRDSIREPHYYPRNEGRTEAKSALLSAANAEKSLAHHKLTELEVRLIEELTLDGLRTDAAKEFVRNMPDVNAVLASVQRRQEIESALESADDE